jgi:hypothetical protein
MINELIYKIRLGSEPDELNGLASLEARAPKWPSEVATGHNDLLNSKFGNSQGDMDGDCDCCDCDDCCGCSDCDCDCCSSANNCDDVCCCFGDCDCCCDDGCCSCLCDC